ncbi:MAG: hypothetical protein KUG75_00865 [Pseudomonadales bacterium]|nr:hypothetical protein [Pseudomonadales bacterium]
MPTIHAKADNLNALNSDYAQVPLKAPVFLNSVPKCGTHLMRNILRMFVSVQEQYHQAFIQIPILKQHLGAFSPAQPCLSWGHLLFSDESAMALKGTRHMVLVRDPFDWVLARARFFLSDTFQGNLEHLKGDGVSIEEVLNMMIFGIYGKAPTLQEIYLHNAVAWLGTGIQLVQYEELVLNLKRLDSIQAEAYFTELLAPLGIKSLPEDWRKRVEVGADRKQSGTARENLAGGVSELPEELPDMQKRLVEVAAPGLRAVLGY